MRKVLIFAAFALVGVFIRVPFVLSTLHAPGFSWHWGGEMFSIAHAVAAGEGFSSPYGAPSGPTAQQVPGFPVLVAGLAQLRGGSSDAGMAFAIRAVLWLNILWSLLTGFVIGAVAERLQKGSRFVVIGVWMLLPLLGFTEVVYPWDTALYVLVLALVVWRLIMLTSPATSVRSFAWFGLLVGASLLLDPAHLVVIVVAMLALVALKRITVTQTLVAGTVAILVITPWVVRNTVMLGRPTGIRSNLGFEIYRGLVVDPWDDGLTAREFVPGRNGLQFLRYRQEGEAAFFADMGQRAQTLVRTQPTVIARRIPRRIKAYWLGGYELDSARKHVLFLLPALAGFVGLVVLTYTKGVDRGTLAILATLVIVLPLPYYLTVSSLRYRAPLEPWFVLLTVCALLSLRPKPLPS